MDLTFLWPDSVKHLFGNDFLEGEKKKIPKFHHQLFPAALQTLLGEATGWEVELWELTLCWQQHPAALPVKEGRKTAPSTLWFQRDSPTPSTTECCSISPALAPTHPVISPAPALPSPTVLEIGSQPISFPSLRGR